MKEYDIIIARNRDFAINLNGAEIGRLEYPKWYSSKPEFRSAAGTVYKIKYKSFWKGTQEVLKDDYPWLFLKRSFRGYTIAPYGKEHHFYKIGRRGAFKDGLIIENYKGLKVAELTVKFTFKKFRTAYTLVTIDDFGDTETEQFLLLFMLQYYREEKRRAAAAAG